MIFIVMENDIISKTFYCPRCQAVLKKKRPSDKFLVVDKEQIVRLFCPCGYYRDEKVNETS